MAEFEASVLIDQTYEGEQSARGNRSQRNQGGPLLARKPQLGAGSHRYLKLVLGFADLGSCTDYKEGRL